MSFHDIYITALILFSMYCIRRCYQSYLILNQHTKDYERFFERNARSVSTTDSSQNGLVLHFPHSDSPSMGLSRNLQTDEETLERNTRRARVENEATGGDRMTPEEYEEHVRKLVDELTESRLNNVAINNNFQYDLHTAIRGSVLAHLTHIYSKYEAFGDIYDAPSGRHLWVIFQTLTTTN